MEPSSHTDDTEPKFYTKISQITSSEGSGRGASGGSAAAELGRRLLLAARTGDTMGVRVLMAQGAPFTTDWLGTNALHLAAGGGHAAACGALLRAGASHDSRNKLERTPLLLAAAAGHAPVVQLLLLHGANVNARDMLHMSALHWAARRGHGRAAALLLRRGADLTARDKFLLTPRDLARRHHPQLLPLLDQTENIPEEIIPPESYIEEEEIYDAEDKTQMEDVVLSGPDVEKEEEPVTPEIKQTNAPGSGGGAEAGVGAGGGAGAGGAAELLALHGITLLPHDADNTVLSALSAGRAVLLSDAGKLMLRDAPALSPLPAPPPPLPRPALSPARPASPVIIRPLAPGKPIIKKIIHPNPTIKYMQLPRNAKIVSATKCVPVKSKSSLSRGGVRIIVNKAPQPSPQLPASPAASAEAPLSPGTLQQQLRAALQGVARLSAELRDARAQLARQNKQ